MVRTIAMMTASQKGMASEAMAMKAMKAPKAMKASNAQLVKL